MWASDRLSFFRSWTANPGRIGAIAPSGAALAALMTSEITAASAPVIELGPGTGVFTSGLVERGVKEQDLILIESCPDFARLLQLRFPKAQVLCMDASQLANSGFFENASIGAVVSGLPLLNLSRKKIITILTGAFGYLRPGGAFYQFTYGPRCPVPRRVLDRLDLKASVVGRTLLNVPPAAVYRITRRKPLSRASA